MSYTILLERQAEKELRNLPPQMLRRMIGAFSPLPTRPWPGGAVKLKGKEGEGWRIKTGDYRILYMVDKTQKVIKVTG